MLKFKIYLLLILLIIPAACITKFEPDIDESGNILVVEGLLTDEYRSNYVKLTWTRPVGIGGLESPVTNAMVYIQNDSGLDIPMVERKPGRYYTDSLEFQAISGDSYKLRINTNGEWYESDFIKMLEVPDIDSLYYEYEYTEDGIWPPLYSYDVFFNTEDETNVCRHFRWTYEEVYEYHLPWHYPPPEKSICWITNKSSDILIKNTSALDHTKIEHFPLVSLDNRSNEKLAQKYSIQLKQYSLNEDEYNYWEQMKKMTGEVGTLYDPVPMPLNGNVRSISDPTKSTLGYFSVSAVETRRLFIDNDTIKMKIPGAYCVTDTLESIQNFSGIGVYIFVLEEIDGVGFLISVFRQCADCTVFGSNIEPLFWNDDLKK